MTVETENITSGPYIGNGLLDTYDYTFGITADDEIKVYEADDGGNVILLILNTDYTVTGAGDDTGGTVTRVAGVLPNNYEWFMRSNIEDTQDTDFESQGAFYPKVHEDAFDKRTRISQQNDDVLQRALRLPESENEYLVDMPSVDSLKGKAIGLDGTGVPVGYPVDTVTSAAFDTISNYNDSLAEAVASIGSGNKTLYVDVVPDDLAAPLTVPDNISLIWNIGVPIDTVIYTLTINGQINAGIYQIFSGAADVVFGSSPVVQAYPEWFGIPGDGLTDNTTLFRVALASGANLFLTQTYKITSANFGVAGQVVSGYGTLITEQPSEAFGGLRMIKDKATVKDITIHNILTLGSVFMEADNPTLTNVTFTELRADGHRGYFTYLGNSDNASITFNKFMGWDYHGFPQLFVASTNSFVTNPKITDNLFHNSGSWGVATHHAKNPIIARNTFTNDVFDSSQVATAAQTVFVFDTTGYPTYPFFGQTLAVDDVWTQRGVGYAVDLSVEDQITVTFDVGQTVGAVIRLRMFNSAENININSNTHNALIVDNVMEDSGDSNITVASDYNGYVIGAGTAADHPTKIMTNQNVFNRAFASSVSITAGKGHSILNNQMFDTGYGNLSTAHVNAIHVPQDVSVIVSGNYITRTATGPSSMRGIIALSISEDIDKVIGPNHFSGENLGYNFAPESVNEMKAGIHLFGEYINYGDLLTVVDDEVWGVPARPDNNLDYTFDTSNNITSVDAVTVMTGGKSIKVTSAVGYMSIFPTRQYSFYDTMVKVSFYAKLASAGTAVVTIHNFWSAIDHTLGIEITSENWTYYEAYVPMGSIFTNLIVRLQGNTTFPEYNVQNIKISRTKYKC